MGFLGSSGLVTRGYGKDHRILTRGFGGRLDLGGIEPLVKRIDYNFNIFAPISKEVFLEIGVYNPFEISKDGKISITSSISKEAEENLNIQVNLDYYKLSEALDSI